MSAMDVPAGGSIPAERSRSVAVPKRAYISWIALAMMTTGSVASLRSSPTMAVYGLACVSLYVVPAIVFLMPTSLVAAELASAWPGGVYRWVSEGISGPMGLLAIWCQFAMTIFYYPSLLAYVASTLRSSSTRTWRATGSTRRCDHHAVLGRVFVSSRGMKAIASWRAAAL